MKHALIIDDNPQSIYLVEYLLKGMNCYSTSFQSGIEAIPYIENDDYDLIILDWDMPGLTATINFISNLGVHFKKANTLSTNAFLKKATQFGGLVLTVP